MVRLALILIGGLLLCDLGMPASANPLTLGFGVPGLHRHVTPPFAPRTRVHLARADYVRALAGGWQPVATAAPFNAGHAMLMTDGAVYIQSPNSRYWFSLSPDATGNYVKGTWKIQATLPANYAPMYFGSAILPDGRLVISGGEYNGSGTPVWGMQSAIYDLTTNTWKAIAAPAGWTSIGDAPTAVLSNGKFMLGNCCSTQAALLNPATLTWSATGANKQGSNNEEGWTLLPSGELLAADVYTEPKSELYDPANGFWSATGTIPVNLTNGGEIGPAILRQNGHVFATGADQYTAIYNPSLGSWSAGPVFPTVNGAQLSISDGPAVLLTNGDVLMAASAGETSPSYFLDFPVSGGTTMSFVPGPPNAVNDASYVYNLLLLPTGQVLETDFSRDVEIFTPQVTPNTSIAPVVTSIPTSLTHGSTYTASGRLFNGVSQNQAYGDDNQSATNYPLIYFVNNLSHVVTFAYTHNFSAMPVASTAIVSTQFLVPPWTPTGASELIVVTNGIQSKPVAVTIH